MTNHFRHWVALTLFSTVSLSAMLNSFAQRKDFDENYNHEDWTREQRWIVSVASISLILSVCGCILHVVKKDFVGKNFELGLVLMILGMWCGGLPTIMDNKHAFALAQGVMIQNMFFASWGALIVSTMLFTKHFRIFMKREGDKNVHNWIGLSVAGLVVMCDSSRLFKDYCEDDIDNDFCRRNIFGLILGSFTFVASGIMACVPAAAAMETFGAYFFVVAWCFGFAYLTYEEGPAVVIGTIYFAVWANLYFSMNMAVPLFFDSFQTVEDAPPAVTEEVSGKDDGMTDPKMGEGEAEEEEVAVETGDV